MSEELLMLYGAAYAVSRFMEKGSKAYARKDMTGKWRSVDWVDILDFLTDLIDNNKEEREEEE